MDQKPWPWRKKSSEKTIVTAENANLTSKENGEVNKLVIFLVSIYLYYESHFYIVLSFSNYYGML